MSHTKASFVKNIIYGLTQAYLESFSVIITYNLQLISPNLKYLSKQMASNTSYIDLLTVGAGPAGLMAACWAAQYNISTRIIDQKAGRTQTGHADGLNSRTLKILDSFSIIDPILKQGVSGIDESYWVIFS